MNLRLRFAIAVIGCAILAGCGDGGDKDQATLITDESGIKYADLVEGAGEPCQFGDIVLVGYTTRLRNGMVVNTSEDGSGPFKIKLGAGAIIKGWDLGIPGMRVGGVRKLVIPAELGFGRNPRPNIPPNSELTVQITLLEISQRAPRHDKKSTADHAKDQPKKS
jgi:FKBP-type peptidyl-prolyl cis-trans isomerase FkpA